MRALLPVLLFVPLCRLSSYFLLRRSLLPA